MSPARCHLEAVFASGSVTLRPGRCTRSDTDRLRGCGLGHGLEQRASSSPSSRPRPRCRRWTSDSSAAGGSSSPPFGLGNSKRPTLRKPGSPSPMKMHPLGGGAGLGQGWRVENASAPGGLAAALQQSEGAQRQPGHRRVFLRPEDNDDYFFRRGRIIVAEHPAPKTASSSRQDSDEPIPRHHRTQRHRLLRLLTGPARQRRHRAEPPGGGE